MDGWIIFKNTYKTIRRTNLKSILLSCSYRSVYYDHGCKSDFTFLLF